MAENRAKKSGIGADIEKKLEQRYDLEEQEGTTQAVQLWINAVLQDDHQPIPSHSQKDLHRSLKDGILLCKLINKLLESDNLPKIHMQKNATTIFPAMTNIENYNKGCVAFGLAKEFTVQSADVLEGKKGPFLNVINNIHSLGFLANRKGFQPTYTGEVHKTIEY